MSIVHFYLVFTYPYGFRMSMWINHSMYWYIKYSPVSECWNAPFQNLIFNSFDIISLSMNFLNQISNFSIPVKSILLLKCLMQFHIDEIFISFILLSFSFALWCIALAYNNARLTLAFRKMYNLFCLIFMQFLHECCCSSFDYSNEK